jgi:hypothetical protein
MKLELLRKFEEMYFLAGGVDQVLECWPDGREVWSSKRGIFHQLLSE